MRCVVALRSAWRRRQTISLGALRLRGLGSIANSADPQSTYSALVVPAYFSSKAALNMLTTQYASAFPRMRINSVDPGFTGTDFNQNRGTQTVHEGTDAIVQMVTIGPDGPTATFVSRAGRVPW